MGCLVKETVDNKDKLRIDFHCKTTFNFNQHKILSTWEIISSNSLLHVDYPTKAVTSLILNWECTSINNGHEGSRGCRKIITKRETSYLSHALCCLSKSVCQKMRICICILDTVSRQFYRIAPSKLAPSSFASSKCCDRNKKLDVWLQTNPWNGSQNWTSKPVYAHSTQTWDRIKSSDISKELSARQVTLHLYRQPVANLFHKNHFQVELCNLRNLRTID